MAPPPLSLSLSLSLSLFHSVLPPSHANPLKYNEIIISDRRRPRDQSAIQETDETEANFLKPPSEDKEKQRRRNRDRTQEMQRTGYHYYCYYYCCYPHYPCGVSYYYSIHFFFVVEIFHSTVAVYKINNRISKRLLCNYRRGHFVPLGIYLI